MQAVKEGERSVILQLAAGNLVDYLASERNSECLESVGVRP